MPRLLSNRVSMGWLDETNHPRQMLDVTGQKKVAN